MEQHLVGGQRKIVRLPQLGLKPSADPRVRPQKATLGLTSTWDLLLNLDSLYHAAVVGP